MIWIARLLALVNLAAGVGIGAVVILAIVHGSDAANWVVIVAGVMAVLSLLSFAATIRPCAVLVFCQVLTAGLFTIVAFPLGLSVGAILLPIGFLTFVALLFTLPEVVKRERHTGEYWREHFRHPGWHPPAP